MTRRGIWFPFNIKAKRKVIPPPSALLGWGNNPIPLPSRFIFLWNFRFKRFWPALLQVSLPFFLRRRARRSPQRRSKKRAHKNTYQYFPLCFFFVMIVASPRERVRAGAPGISRADGRRPTTSSGFVWRAACVFRASLAGTCVAFRLSGCAKGVYIQ